MTALADPRTQDLLDTLPDEHREALRRCSMMTIFDKDTYDAVLRPPGGPELGELINAQLVEHLSGGDTSCRVQPALQDAAWATWFPHGRPARSGPAPQALRAMAREVADWCADRRDDVERLRALLLIDQRQARTWFQEAFTACDKRSDFAGCTNLINVLCEPARRPFVGRALAADSATQQRYLAARRLWRAAYDCSAPARYLRRAALEKSLNALLTDDGPRMLRLTGSGGYGKSTLIRWFLARRCVPERIPCALVDLDRPLDPVNATRHPWLLLLEIAYQLNDQMAATPFRALLRDYISYRHVLHADESPEGRVGAAALGTAAGEADAGEIVAMFIDALRDAAPPAPVVVLDTIEEAMLREAHDVATLVATLNLLRRETPLRLVVAGRRTAPEKPPDVPPGEKQKPPAVRLGEDAEVCVPKFTRRQSRRYLSTVRHVRPELIHGIVLRADGLPWQLALWGDVVDAYPELTPEHLPRVRPEAAWVVDRIVGRIENPLLQWLVRYGVVPRRLHRAFAEQVLLPQIERTLSGAVEDDPRRDARPQGPDAAPVFHTDLTVPAGGAEFAAAWQELTRYASTTSWLWLADGDPDTVVFQPELRNPVRALLAGQPIGELLHRRAADYYTALAQRDRPRWTSWTCEALYHRFCAADPDAAAHWRRAGAAARQMGLGGDSIAQLAGELLGPEYHLAAPAGWPGIDRQTRAAAHAELAWAECRIAVRGRLPAGHAVWSTVESNLAAADRLGPDPESEQRRRAARAALNLARNRLELAAPELAALAADGGGPSVDHCVVLLLLAEAQAATPHQRIDARRTLARAAEMAATLGIGEVSARVAVAVADGAAAIGRLDVADEGLRRAVATHPSLADDPELLQTRARCALASGRPATALRLAPERAAVRAEAQLALGDADGAVRSLTHLLAGLVEPERRATLLVVRAQAHARLFLVDEAIDDLVQARELCGQIGDIEGAGRCTALAAEVMLHDVGNLLEAGQYLEEAGRLALDPGSPAWARCRLLAAELHARRDEQSPEAQAQQAKAAEETLDIVVGRCSDPRLIVDVALTARCWSPGLEQHVRAALQQNLTLISPPMARLTALAALPDCRPWSWGRRLMKLALPTGRTWNGVDPDDTPWMQLRAAELKRVARQPEEAAELLGAATDVLVERTPLAGWLWLQAARRPGLPPLAEHPAARRFPDDQRFPLLAAAQGITLAEQRLATGDRDGAIALFGPADVALRRGTPRATAWESRLLGLRRLTEVAQGSAAVPSRAWLLQEANRRRLGHAPQRTEAESPEPPPSTGSEHQELTVVLDGAALVLTGPAGRTRLPATHPMVAALCEETRSTGRSPVTRWVREQLPRPEGLLALDPVLAPGSADLTLLAAEPRVAQLPWELATLGDSRIAGHAFLRSVRRTADPATTARTRVRMLQEALTAASAEPGPIDGLHGPETAAALHRFQVDADVAPDGAAGEQTWEALRAHRRTSRPAVVVLQAPGGPDREPSYRKRGWRHLSLPSVDSIEIERALPPGPVDVLHIVATMQLTGGVPVLALAESDPLRPGTLTCTLLDSLIHRLAARGGTPLVVLDIGAQPHLSEAVRQLLLRNDFAQQLLGLGQCYGILATGPTASDDPLLVAKAVAEAPTATELARQLQADAPVPGEVLPRSATALFTALLADRMPRLAPTTTAR